ncbi:MAG: hypothetical protein Ct9H90mP25_2270 [Gammaproteobacteria bacterium]|nr:MAG: hypothetical protein Ct9H90mP25_2270 [Gammaproteobacteria bacterium]
MRRIDHLRFTDTATPSNRAMRFDYRGAKSVGISYKTAWDRINMMNNLSDKPLVRRSAGGSGGGGTSLTELGKEL